MRTIPAPRSSSTPRRGRIWWLATFASAVIAAVIVPAVPAHSADYPSWSDVEAARTNETSKQVEIDRLTSLLSSFDAHVAAAQQGAALRGAAYEAAQERLDRASLRVATLDAQAIQAARQANRSQTQAGQLARQLARVGDVGPSLALFLNQDQANGLLYRLGVVSKLAERSSVAFVVAKKHANVARGLTDQARVAKAARSGLVETAKRALREAAAAAKAVEAQLADRQVKQGVLDAQITVHRENRSATEADYRTGQQIRQQQQAAAAAAAGTNSAASAGDPGQLGGQGRALPVSAWISDRFGLRPDKPVASSGSFHYATDLAAGYGAPIYAATGGTVFYVGWLGTHGNRVLIDHGNGIQTGYAHIQPAGILVSVGQDVSAGANIARVGTTGGSSGCHLHFEVRVDGSRVDPEPLMSARGIHLG